MQGQKLDPPPPKAPEPEPMITGITREGFLRKNIVAVSFFQNCAIHQYS